MLVSLPRERISSAVVAYASGSRVHVRGHELLQPPLVATVMQEEVPWEEA